MTIVPVMMSVLGGFAYTETIQMSRTKGSSNERHNCLFWEIVLLLSENPYLLLVDGIIQNYLSRTKSTLVKIYLNKK